jgi:Protein of unknown function (DUF2281)
MSTEAVNKILDEMKALTAEERRQLLERLTREQSPPQQPTSRRAGTLKGTVKYMAADFDAPIDDFKEYME